MKKTILAAAAALALSGCVTPVVTPNSSVDVAVVTGETSYEVAHNVAVKFYLKHLPQHPEWRTTVKPWLIKSYHAVLLARRAQDAGDATTLAAQIAAASAALAQIRPIMGLK